MPEKETKQEQTKLNNSASTKNLFKYIHLPGLCQVGRVFANGPGDVGYSSSRTKKMVLHAALLNTQYYKVRIMDEV